MRWLILAAALSLLACGDDDDEATRAARPDPAPPAPAPAPEPEAPPAPPPLPEAREVRIEAEDGVVLVGDLRAGAGPSAPLVVLVHQLSSDRAEWAPLARWLAAEPALTTFAVDLRGHGESTSRARGGEVAWRDFEAADRQKIAGDVRAVIDHLTREEGLSPSRVALVGSSIGSSAVVVAAAEDERVDAVVALSPGRAYRGVDALTPLTTFGARPLLAVASRGEAASAETATHMARIATNGEALLVDGERHGVAMFEEAPESLDRVVAFLRQHASAR